MNKTFAKHLERLIQEGQKLSNWAQYRDWSPKVEAFLSETLGHDESQRFAKLIVGGDKDSGATHSLRLGHLKGMVAKAEHLSSDPIVASTSALAPSIPVPLQRADSRKVFVVHGHDAETKESTARFLERLGLEPIILHEQASAGRTIIEKFEMYSEDVAFAVVLLTPDDVGSTVDDPSNLRKRARQNVIMELGYFMGRLGRTRVCALYKGDVELPSDYQGVLYIEIDAAGAWKAKLAQEFVEAKMSIDLAGLLKA